MGAGQRPASIGLGELELFTPLSTQVATCPDSENGESFRYKGCVFRGSVPHTHVRNSDRLSTECSGLPYHSYGTLLGASIFHVSTEPNRPSPPLP